MIYLKWHMLILNSRRIFWSSHLWCPRQPCVWMPGVSCVLPDRGLFRASGALGAVCFRAVPASLSLYQPCFLEMLFLPWSFLSHHLVFLCVYYFMLKFWNYDVILSPEDPNRRLTSVAGNGRAWRIGEKWDNANFCLSAKSLPYCPSVTNLSCVYGPSSSSFTCFLLVIYFDI